MESCNFCGKLFKTERGLKQHLSVSNCAPIHEASLGVTHNNGPLDDKTDIDKVFGLKRSQLATANSPRKRKALLSDEDDYRKQGNLKIRCFEVNDPALRAKLASIEPRKLLDDRKMPAQETDLELLEQDSSANNSAFLDPVVDENEDENNQNNNLQPDDSNLTSFQNYCDYAATHFAPLSKDHEAAIRLMDILKRKKAPLDTYDEVMEWHLRDKGLLLDGDTVAQCDSFISRKVLIKYMKKRYHMVDKFPFVKELILPHSRAKVNVVCALARDCIESLLTDPRLQDDDLSLFNQDPLAPPPEDLDYVADLNTAQAYCNGHKEYVTKPNQLGVGIIWYIDGAVTGQFENLEITALKMSLSIFSRQYRMKDHAWRTLGYVVNYSKAASRGKKMFVDSKHIDSRHAAMELMEEEGDITGNEDPVEKPQDFHAQLNTILSSYVELEASGMLWDLFYRGKVHKLELVFWTIMVKCDTDEAELLTGKYRSRSGNVRNLCRYCTCSNQETDNPKACYPFKTVPMIQQMIDDGDRDGLKDISQQMIDNAWYKVRFNPGNSRGIHGACPSEMLHAILLGIFKYARECFFTQIGKTSTLATEINALAKVYGELFTRQSERDVPKCKFSEGIRKQGKLMAKEYRGVLLVMAAILRSTEGQKLLKRNKNFKEDFLIKDWLLLVEMLLEWEAYLCEPRMQLDHVRRMMRKNRFIMHILKKVARRSEGMGLKLMKFHGIIHMALDIILYGVPMEHDTGANESGHKGTKAAAKLTQKKATVFEIQTATRLAEFLLIELGMQELEGRPLWDYFEGYWDDLDTNLDPGDDNLEPDDDNMPAQDKITTTGTRITVFEDSDGEVVFKMKSKMKEKDSVIWDVSVTHCLFDLQTLLSDWIPVLPIYTEHKRNGQIFRSHPNFRQEGPWRDWVLVDWGEGYGTLPCEIWCFVVLDGLPDEDDQDPPLNFGGIDLKNGTYALVEASTWSTNERDIGYSDIFVPFKKDVAALDKDGVVTGRRLFLADVEAFVSPLCVIPDIGSQPRCKYFQVRPRSAWVKEFIAWLEDPHCNDDMTD